MRKTWRGDRRPARRRVAVAGIVPLALIVILAAAAVPAARAQTPENAHMAPEAPPQQQPQAPPAPQAANPAPAPPPATQAPAAPQASAPAAPPESPAPAAPAESQAPAHPQADQTPAAPQANPAPQAVQAPAQPSGAAAATQPASRTGTAPAGRRAPERQESAGGPAFSEKIEVREVLLDALVTDRQGKVIVGLNRNDFTVTENGKPVELTGVTFYSNRRLVGGSAALAGRGVSAEQAPEDRYFILFVQDQRFRTRGDDASEGSRLLAREVLAGRQIKEWVDREVLPNDWVAVVGYDVRLKIYQDLTHDHSLIESAINDAVKGRDVENNWPSRLPAPGAGPSLLTGLPRGTELRARTPTFFDAIQVLARAAGNIPARKNVVLLTSGGFEELSTAPYRQFMPDKRYFIPTTEALNSNNMAVYPVDLWPPGQISHTSDDVLNLLAAETGGRYIFNVNNFTNALGDISAENNGYYLLSYRSEHPAGSSGFQKVEVRTTNPELKVKARQGYEWGPGPETAAAAAR